MFSEVCSLYTSLHFVLRLFSHSLFHSPTAKECLVTVHYRTFCEVKRIWLGNDALTDHINVKPFENQPVVDILGYFHPQTHGAYSSQML